MIDCPLYTLVYIFFARVPHFQLCVALDEFKIQIEIMIHYALKKLLIFLTFQFIHLMNKIIYMLQYIDWKYRSKNLNHFIDTRYSKSKDSYIYPFKDIMSIEVYDTHNQLIQLNSNMTNNLIHLGVDSHQTILLDDIIKICRLYTSIQKLILVPFPFDNVEKKELSK